jgi:hypothetical protein
MIRKAAALLRTRYRWQGFLLANYAFGGMPYPYDGTSWRPTSETFLGWLVHHRIAYKLDRGLYCEGPMARVFAELPNRNRVFLVGKLILEREGAVVAGPSRAPRRPRATSRDGVSP